MLSKPFSLFLVYILTIFNLIILIAPFLAAIFPFMKIQGSQIVLANYLAFNPKITFFALIFIISFLMIIYLILDFIFGFSVRFALEGCKQFNRLKDYEFLHETFNEIKTRFACPTLKLYIKNSEEINAFAVGGMRKKAVVLTSGLINHYAQTTDNGQQFIVALRSILGHEMSHLINKDFLPGLLIIINQKITNFVSGILYFIFHSILRFFTLMRIQNIWISQLMMSIYGFTNWILTFFDRLIIQNIYEFLSNFFGRAVEYRCDRQSAKAFGGMNMAFALSKLGKSGYLTLFSTHPATQRRMRKVEIVEEKNIIIRTSFWSDFSNWMAMFILPLICYYAAHLSKADLLIKYYFFYNYHEVYLRFLPLVDLVNH